MTTKSVHVGRTSGNTGSKSDNKNRKNNESKAEAGQKEEQSSEKERRFAKYRRFSFSTAQTMVNKFLTCDRIETIEARRLKYTKRELTRKLNISIEELEQLNKPYFYGKIAVKLTLSLSKLYCSTKWVTEEKKEERYETTNRLR